ncbi:MAG: hypothetical protein ACRCST_07790 [Turicibacter sp.]
MATQVQKNFRKEMRKYNKAARKQRGNRKPISYIYKFPEDIESFPTLSERIGRWMPRLIMMGVLLYVTGMGSYLNKVIQELFPFSSLNHQRVVFEFMDEYKLFEKQYENIIVQHNNGTLKEVDLIAYIQEATFTKKYEQAIFDELNDLIDQEVELLIPELRLNQEGSYESQLEFLDYSMKLTNIQYDLHEAVVSLLEQTNFKYEILLDGSIAYESKYPIKALE